MTVLEQQYMNSVISINRMMRKAQDAEPDWEQRRYETASRIMVAMVSNTERSLGFRAVAEAAEGKELKTKTGSDISEADLMAAEALGYAKALIAMLRSEKPDNEES